MEPGPLPAVINSVMIVLGRLTDAEYGEGPSLSVNTNRFNEQVTGYDKMGNILGLKRYGQTSATGYDVIDDLSLSYAGNRLKKVTDRSTTLPSITASSSRTVLICPQNMNMMKTAT